MCYDTHMSEDHKNVPDLSQYVKNWAAAQPVLESLREIELIAVDTTRAMESLSDLFDDAVKRFPPPQTSGLVEQQRLFGLLKNEFPPSRRT